MIQELSRATGLGFSVSQFPLLILILMYYPDPECTTYIVHFKNMTIPREYYLEYDTTGLSVSFLVTSAAIAIFSTMTAQLQESQIIDNMIEFGSDLSSNLFAWNFTQYFIIFNIRVHVIALLCSPLDLYFLYLAVLLQGYAIVQLISPKANHDTKLDNFALILFVGVVLLVFNYMPVKHGVRMVYWTMLCVCDFLLIIGHTYDTQRNTETVANCRVFYNCCVASIHILLYIS